MPPRGFVAADPRAIALTDAPINPAWVRAGAPRARLGEIARSADGTCAIVVWDCTAGVFEWRFGVDETVQIIDGAVTVADATGRERALRPGDVAFFPAGSASLWRVETYVRKVAVCRHAMPAPLGFVLRAFNKLKTLAGFGAGGAAMTPAQPSAG